jgi:uncharacterized repeat protein (TIGR03803 family)
MKVIFLLTVSLLCAVLLPAQGVYQLWGMTTGGGAGNASVLFSTNATGDNYRVRHYFKAVTGTNSTGTLSVNTNNGKLYGMTSLGGANNGGVIFEFDPGTNTYINKMDLSAGSNPSGNLTFIDNKFYGGTRGGGILADDNSTISPYMFEWDPAANIFTDRYDFTSFAATTPSFFHKVNGKLYGLGLGNPFYPHIGGYIFEWNRSTDVVTNKHVFTVVSDMNSSAPNGMTPSWDMTYYNGKFYGTTTDGGNGYYFEDFPGSGVIYEWDPVTNIYTKKLDFDTANSSRPIGGLVLKGNKFYGINLAGGANNRGAIFEWDPATNVLIEKFNFDTTVAPDYARSFTLNGDKFYGLTRFGGAFNLGTIFEWDPATNIYTKKHDFNGPNGSKPTGNHLIVLPAPVANGLAGSCQSLPSVTIDNSNNNKWVSITDSYGNAVAEIKANGNNLGIVTASVFINNGPIRETDAKKPYLDRSITINSQFQPSTPVDLRLYIKGSEYLALKNAVNSNGEPSGINDINDVGVFKVKANCRSAVPSLAAVLRSSAEPWGTGTGDYVFSTSVNSFSSYYFANRYYCTSAPVISDVVVNGNLWPPLHSLRTVGIAYATTFNSSACGVVTNWLTVKSNEPESGTGVGDRSPDWVIVDPHHVQLRAERADNGTGRIYTITIHSKNAAGYESSYDVQMTVPLQTNPPQPKFVNNDDKFGRMLNCSVAPNPASQYFNLQIASSSDAKIEVNILDVSGRSVERLTAAGNRTLRLGENLKPGLYLVSVVQGDQKQVLKVIKQ